MMGLPRFWLVCVVPLALADRCARVRTIDEQLVHKAAASLCAVIALPGSLTLNISTSGGLVARNYTKIIGLADEVYSGRWQWRDGSARRVPGTIISPAFSNRPWSPTEVLFCREATPRSECMARADRSSADRDSLFMPIVDDAGDVPVGVPSLITVAPHATLHLVNLTLFDGVASNGGAISVAPDGELVCENVEFDRNGAILGGALHVGSGARVRLRDVNFARNVASWYGGAVWLSPNASLEVATTQFDRNAAGFTGGAICANCAPRYIYCGPQYGGANCGSGTTITTRVIIADSTVLTNYVLEADEAHDLFTFFDFHDAVVTLDDLRFWLGETGAGGEFNSMIAASGERTSLELINSSLEMAGFTFDARFLRVEDLATARIERVYLDGTYWGGHEFGIPFSGPATTGAPPLLEVVNAGEVVVADSTFIAFGTSIRLRTGGFRRLTEGDDGFTPVDDWPTHMVGADDDHPDYFGDKLEEPVLLLRTRLRRPRTDPQYNVMWTEPMFSSAGTALALVDTPLASSNMYASHSPVYTCDELFNPPMSGLAVADDDPNSPSALIVARTNPRFYPNELLGCVCAEASAPRLGVTCGANATNGSATWPERSPTIVADDTESDADDTEGDDATEWGHRKRPGRGALSAALLGVYAGASVLLAMVCFIIVARCSRKGRPPAREHDDFTSARGGGFTSLLPLFAPAGRYVELCATARSSRDGGGEEDDDARSLDDSRGGASEGDTASEAEDNELRNVLRKSDDRDRGE